ncbi:MAG: immunoglobulin domain-containing protein [Verrucomicrobia bacterium]|nr:immunoglobulin domain-containing protein [Verrucomicrobiota bacterium]
MTNCTQDALVIALATGGNVNYTQNCSIVLSSTITITTNVTLDASGRTVSISGSNSVQLFTVPAGISLTLKGLTLLAGRSTTGGAIQISPGAQVIVTNCIFGGNGAVGASGFPGSDGNSGNYGQNGTGGTAGAHALGGAIYNLGSLTIYNSSFLTNSAAGGSGGSGGNGGDGLYQGGNGGNGGAGALGFGGAIYSPGTLWLTNCTFIGNKATGGKGGDGGTNGAGAFPGNSGRGGAGAPGSGAAVYSGQSLTAFASTFGANVAQSGNSADGGTDSSGNGVNGPRGPDSLGGGIYLQGNGTLNNCTFANNTVTGGAGGNGGDANAVGLHTAGSGGDGGNGMGGGLYNTGIVSVVNCTFSSCGAVGGANGLAGSPALANKDGALGRGRGGDVAQGSGSFVLRNSILAASSAGTNAYDTSASRITDGGFNISSDASLNLSGTSLKNTDPKVGSLADNGGPTQTIALQTNSPAINAVPAVVSPATDQRGVPRPQGAACDIGAYELVTLPAIVSQPQSQTNANGTPVTFMVSELGGTLSYQWRFNATAIASAVSTSYSLSSVDQTNAGSYDVVITNSYGAITSAPATLTVIFPPIIVVQPTNVAVLVGGNATFSLNALSGLPLGYQWQLNGTNIAGASGFNPAGPSRATFTLTNGAQAADAGTYTAILTNLYGSVTSTPAILSVYVLPSVTTQPISQTAIVGSNVTFSAAAVGTPPFFYQWLLNGNSIAGATASTYSITNAQTTNSGSYRVTVANYFGSTNSQPATLTVVYPYAISGQVLDPGGTNGLPGVTVSAGTNSVVTDTNGNYVFSGLSSNIYNVTPSLACYVFGPTNSVAGVGPTNAFGVNFFATNDFHSVSGSITNGPAGVTVTVSGTNGTSVVSSDAGVYGVSNLCPGFYFVVPSLPGYRFQPATNSILVPPDTNTVNFTPVQLFGISGQISQGTSGLGLTGITVTVTGPVATNVITGATGAYLVGALPAGDYVVSPTAPSCSHLNLTSRSVTLGPTNASGTDFVVLRDAYTISGHLTNGTTGVSGITVGAGGTNVTMTGPNGLYVFSNLCAGSYTLTPSANCYQVAPASRTVTVGPGDANAVDFGATTLAYTISGRITDGGVGVSNVTVQAASQTAHTDPNGNFVFSGLCPGSYTVIPSQACRIFNPASIPVTLGPNAGGVNFVTFSNDLSRIRGQITDGVNGLSNVLITATGGMTAVTDTGGNYMFSSLCPGTYTLTPLVTNRCLNTASLTVTVGSAQTTNGVNFVATPGQYLIGGTLVGMPPGPKVTVSVAGPMGASVLITYTGTYSISNLCPGNYTVTPSNACYQFYPTSWTTTVGPSDDSLDFAVSGGGGLSIRGFVTHNGIGLSNATVIAAGQTNKTDASGSYAFYYLCPGDYTVTAFAPGFQVDPATNYVTLSGADANGVNFSATGRFSLIGRVVEGTNGLPGVKLLTGTNVSYTGTGGYYTNLNLVEGTDLRVVPSLAGYAFAPSVQSLVILSNTSLLDFMAFPSLALAPAGNGAYQLTFTPAFTCQVEASTNFIDWQPVFSTNNISTSTLLLQFTDTNAANLPMRFYRLAQTFAGPPILTGLLATNRSVSLDCVAAAALNCQIEASTNLTSWVTIFTSNLPPATPFQFSYGDATNLPVRFYRLSQAPGF